MVFLCLDRKAVMQDIFFNYSKDSLCNDRKLVTQYIAFWLPKLKDSLACTGRQPCKTFPFSYSKDSRCFDRKAIRQHILLLTIQMILATLTGKQSCKAFHFDYSKDVLCLDRKAVTQNISFWLPKGFPLPWQESGHERHFLLSTRRIPTITGKHSYKSCPSFLWLDIHHPLMLHHRLVISWKRLFIALWTKFFTLLINTHIYRQLHEL